MAIGAPRASKLACLLGGGKGFRRHELVLLQFGGVDRSGDVTAGQQQGQFGFVLDERNQAVFARARRPHQVNQAACKH